MENSKLHVMVPEGARKTCDKKVRKISQWVVVSSQMPWAWFHLWHFLGRVWAQVLAWNSATSYSTARDIALPIVVLVLLVGVRIRGWRKPGVRDLVVPAFKTVVAMLALLALAFLAAIPVIVWQDHQDFARRVAQLKNKTQDLGHAVETQGHTIAILEGQLREKPHIITRTVAASQPPIEERISAILLEVRLTCLLRDPSKIPDDLMLALLPNPDRTHLQGTGGSVALRTTPSVSYKRSEQEGTAFVLQRYELPSASDLIGQPISKLNDFTTLVIDLWGVPGNSFTAVTYAETTLRVNGNDVFRRSEPFNVSGIPDRKEITLSITVKLDGIKLTR